MKWLRHRKARQDRDSGIVFAWRGMHGRVGGMMIAVVVVGLAAVTLASVIKVRVLSPPARSQRRGEVMMALDDRIGDWLNLRGAEMTPFPGPLDVWDFDATGEALASHPALAGDEPGGYVPPARPLPEVAGAAALPVGDAGRRLLPALPPLPAPVEPGPPVKRRFLPVLSPDSLELAARVPVPLPGFGAGDIPFSGERRFLLAVGGDGLVRVAQPLDGGGDEAGPVVEGWLRRVRFEPVESVEDWFVVSIRFLSTDD